MGVAGAGKSTVGALVAGRLGVPFLDADDFHDQSSIDAIRAGIALDDRLRQPWLHRLNRELRAHQATGVVLACSALKRSYRDVLRQGLDELHFVQLTVSEHVLAARDCARGSATSPAWSYSPRSSPRSSSDDDVIAVDGELAPGAVADEVLRVTAPRSTDTGRRRERIQVQASERGLCRRTDAILRGVRLGIAHHLGWAVAVTASADHQVVDRRRIELVEPDTPTAPIHHEGKPLDDAAAAVLVAQVRASAVRATSAALDELATAVARTDHVDVAPSLAARLPRRHRHPTSRAVRGPRRLRHVPPGAGRTRTRARLGRPPLRRQGRGGQSREHAGERADEVLFGPRATLGPPWAKDHRMALAATIVAG